MFDQKTIIQLNYYVYALIDPFTNMPFYIGKGKGNRVFNHVDLALETETSNDKYETIREIQNKLGAVKHIIIRHGLTEQQAFEIEATIIDLLEYLKISTTNIAGGHNTFEFGVMTTDDIIRLYNAKPLTSLQHPAIIININAQYKRGMSDTDLYNATRYAWVINKNKTKWIKVVLAEYKGLIIEVFSVDNWYEVPSKDKKGKEKIRWAFNGSVANDEIRNYYINRSITHLKRKGNANPIRYNL
ncbi:MAG: hypothetical protein JSS91_00965 [Bacteroidetes bacterium]|nr:hypothetical protein [Bacteroidota bacterium]